MRWLILLPLPCAMLVCAQSSYQVLLDIAEPSSNHALTVIPSTDDGAIWIFDDSVDSYVFRRFDANGTHEWSHRVQSPEFINGWTGSANPGVDWEDGHWWPFIPDGNGGLIYCYSTAARISADGEGLDTNITSTAILRMNAEGEITAFDGLKTSLIMPADSILPLLGGQHPTMALMPNGDLIVFESHFSVWSAVSFLQGTRILASGEIAWTRWYHLPGEFPTQGPGGDMGQFQQMIPRTSGGFYMVDGFVKRVLSFDAEGHCLWAKSYAYDGTPLPYCYSPALSVDPISDELIIIDNVNTWAGRKQDILRIAPDGALLAVSIFAYPAAEIVAAFFERMGVMSDGRTVVGERMGTMGQTAFSIIEADGQSADHFRPVLGNDPPFNFLQYWRSFASGEDRMFAIGTCDVIDVVLGSSTHYPMLASFPLDLMGGCRRSESHPTATSAISVCTSTTLPSWLDVQAQGECVLLPLDAPVVAIVLPPTIIDFCEYSVGVADPHTAVELSVAPTICTAGEPLWITALQEALIVLRSGDGRLVRTFRHPGGTSMIETGDLAGGVYLLTCCADAAATPISRRIIVMR